MVPCGHYIKFTHLPRAAFLRMAAPRSTWACGRRFWGASPQQYDFFSCELEEPDEPDTAALAAADEAIEEAEITSVL
jgi:hypothetical protein